MGRYKDPAKQWAWEKSNLSGHDFEKSWALQKAEAALKESEAKAKKVSWADIHESRLDVPVKNVLASIKPRGTADLTGAEVDLLAFFDQFFGDLDSRLGAAHDKNAAGFQLGRVTIFGGVYLVDP